MGPYLKIGKAEIRSTRSNYSLTAVTAGNIVATMSHLDLSNDKCETSNTTFDGDKEHVEFIDENIVNNDDNVDIIDNEDTVEIVDNMDIEGDNKESN
ncbi:hypothetical protein Scep_026550 [Stephania cephalantha]|uniref:Uncharacterized protein n=1 Tax=Stephania cephalantha TaxID=152367 RepID=A0AAP0EKE1_9MAGN